MNALAKGEIDVLERPAFESYEQLKKADGVILVTKDPLGFQYMGRFNHLHPPFNNPKIRQAALAAMQQEPFLRAQVGIKEFYKPCASMFTCGTPYGSAKGSDIQSKSNMKKAQELLKASGYDGTPGGDPQADRPRRDPEAAGRGGAAAAPGRLQGGPAGDGLEHGGVAPREEGAAGARAAGTSSSPPGSRPTSGTRSPTPPSARRARSPGSAGRRDEQIEKLRDQFARATDDAKKKALAEAIQVRAFEIGTHAPLGEYVNPLATRKNISGWVIGPGDIYWNVKKN